jgi:hypothetical protein
MTMGDKRPILCLDFDGVLHSYTSGWKGAGAIPDPPVPGAMEFLWNAMRRFEVHIYSSRSRSLRGRWAMKRWLFQHMAAWIATLHYDHPAIVEITASSMDPWDVTLRDGARDIVHRLRWPWFKPSAMVTIDDRAVTFTGTWPAVEELLEFKPWNKRPAGMGAHAVCKAMHSGAGGTEPQDCDWPVCGCDPHATKVIEALLEGGASFEQVRPVTYARAGEVVVCENGHEITTIARDVLVGVPVDLERDFRDWQQPQPVLGQRSLPLCIQCGGTFTDWFGATWRFEDGLRRI